MIQNPIYASRQLRLLLAALFTIILLAACGGSATPEAPAATEAPAPTEAPAATEAPTEAPTEAALEATEAPVEEATEEATAEAEVTEAVAVTETTGVTETGTVTGTEEMTSTSEATEGAAAEVAAFAGPDPVLANSEEITVEVAAAEVQEPRGVVIAPAGVNVRTGPSTQYDIIGVVPQGTEGEIVGVSEDGAWWVAHVPSAPNEQGWVAAAYVRATNAGNVPVVPTPPLPDHATSLPAAGVPNAAPVAVPDSLDPNSVIVFSGSRVLRDGNRAYDLEDIYSVRAAPGSPAQLIIQNAMQPSLQPGGEILAFRSTQSDQLGLGGQDFAIDQRVRYSVNLEDSRPSWNPAGDRFVFSSNRTGDRRWRVYTTAATPGNDRAGFSELTELGFGKDADWHPSQNLIVFKGCDDTGNACGIWTMNSDGSNRAPLTDGFNDSLPRWSSDGSSVVFMSDSRDDNWELYTLTVADGTITRLTDNAANDGLPAWSPDNSQVAFMSNRNGAWGIWIVPASGGNAQLVTALEEQMPDWLLQGIDWPR